ncbi:uncharacterized protein LOC131501580 [Neofelis nebulosa]|uniref:uncharacterized protein LOC131501580 n=1 Tax=Neofelis nebulosa TaxID=61452 RepID=UPI00272D2A85|nr:uncharacterized protein LOC131501580 [Neofelis nebulosa]
MCTHRAALPAGRLRSHSGLWHAAWPCCPVAPWPGRGAEYGPLPPSVRPAGSPPPRPRPRGLPHPRRPPQPLPRQQRAAVTWLALGGATDHVIWLARRGGEGRDSLPLLPYTPASGIRSSLDHPAGSRGAETGKRCASLPFPRRACRGPQCTRIGAAAKGAGSLGIPRFHHPPFLFPPAARAPGPDDGTQDDVVALLWVPGSGQQVQDRVSPARPECVGLSRGKEHRIPRIWSSLKARPVSCSPSSPLLSQVHSGNLQIKLSGMFNNLLYSVEKENCFRTCTGVFS